MIEPLGDIVLGSRVAVRHAALEVTSACTAMVADLTDDELRLAWRSSHDRLALLTAQPDLTAARAAAAIERAWYLDEIERRTHDGFTAWLEAGALPDHAPPMAPRAPER